jgi:23S rRNA pseudouridine2605 synthase/16S rRNA pseudouridine516 synthase
VIDLVRRSFGPLHLGTLPAGQWRDLTKLERGEILALARGGSTNDVDSAEHGE